MPSSCNGKAPSDATQSAAHPFTSALGNPFTRGRRPASTVRDSLESRPYAGYFLPQRFSLLNCHHYNPAAGVCQRRGGNFLRRNKYFSRLHIQKSERDAAHYINWRAHMRKSAHVHCRVFASAPSRCARRTFMQLSAMNSASTGKSRAAQMSMH